MRLVSLVTAIMFFNAACQSTADSRVSSTTRAPKVDGLVRITLVGLNDVHGTVEPRDLTLGAGGSAVKTRVGGLDALASYLEVLRAEKGPNVVVLDAGDAYQGTLISNAALGRPVVDAYNALGIAASTFGNHEFDFGQDNLRSILKAAQYPYVSVNVVPENEQRALPNVRPSRVIEIGKLRIGIIGATTATTPQQSKAKNIEGFTFKSLLDTVPAEAEMLRAAGANVVILITHAGGTCDMSRAAEQGDAACAMPVDDEVTELLKASPGVVDAVVAGHQHLAQAHLIRGTPVLQTTGYASSMSMVDMWVDPSAASTSEQKARIPHLEIHKPTYLCYEHFEGYESCNVDEVKHGGAYPATFGATKKPRFLGKEVVVDGATLKSVLAPYRAAVKALAEEPVTTLPKALPMDRTKESPAANCFVDVLRQGAARATGRVVDAAILGSGGIRTGLPEGKVNFGALYSVFPFDNSLAIARLNAKELAIYGRLLSVSVKSIAVVSENWGVRLSEPVVFPRHREFILTAEGGDQVLDDGRLYTVAVPEYNVLAGGETYAAFATAQNEGRVEMFDTLIRDLVAQELRRSDFNLPSSCLGEGATRTRLVQP